MVGPHGRNALVVTWLAALLTIVSSIHGMTPARAEANPRIAASTRVAQIISRRKLLEEQLARLKTQLPTKRAKAATLQALLDAPAYSLANAPQERAKLLDQTAEGLYAVSAHTSKLIANASEDLALEAELGTIVAAAQRDAEVATLDTTPRGRLAAQRAKAFLVALKTRAKALPPRAREERRVRIEAIVDRWRALKSDAEQLSARLRTELRFASVTQTGASEAGLTPTPLQACKARDLDWRNVTITVAGQSMKLRDGLGTLAPTSTGGSESLVVKQVDFADTNQDGREEALMLVERERRPQLPGKRTVTKSDVLYVFESALDCSLRRRAEVTLSTEGGGTGSAVRGGYAYTGHDGVHSYQWTAGRLDRADAALRDAQASR